VAGPLQSRCYRPPSECLLNLVTLMLSSSFPFPSTGRSRLHFSLCFAGYASAESELSVLFGFLFFVRRVSSPLDTPPENKTPFNIIFVLLQPAALDSGSAIYKRGGPPPFFPMRARRRLFPLTPGSSAPRSISLVLLRDIRRFLLKFLDGERCLFPLTEYD